jgi:molybdenum cofactor biosynthesis protein B
MDAQENGSVTIHLIAVREDEGASSSEALVPLLESAGHKVSGPEVVLDNPQAVRAALDGAIQAARTRCVIVYSDASPTLRDGAADVVSDRLERPLPGFGELIRQMAYEDIGGAAILSRACAGIAGHTLIFALPEGSEVQAEAARKLILPTLKQLARDNPGQTDGMMPTTLSQPVARGWQAATEAMGGTLVRDAWPTLPSLLSDRAAVRAVFDTAGERGVLACPNRCRYAVFGFPDLQRPTSKVLLTADGGRADYIIALHRFPDPVGILGPGAPQLLTDHSARTDKVCREIVGTPIDGDGFTVFAVDRGRVFLEREGAIGSWDGKQLEDQGTPNQVGASLVLRWSQR